MGNTKDIHLVLDMSDNDIDDLHYFIQQVDTSSSSPKDEIGDTTIVKRDLPKGFKRLVKIFVSFHKYLRAEGADIYFDWSNIDLDTFTHYRQYIYDSNVTTPAQAGFQADGNFAWRNYSSYTVVPTWRTTSAGQFNIGSHFNHNTGVFTCPVAGRYLVNILAYVNDTGDTYAQGRIGLNGAYWGDNLIAYNNNDTSYKARRHSRDS